VRNFFKYIIKNIYTHRHTYTHIYITHLKILKIKLEVGIIIKAHGQRLKVTHKIAAAALACPSTLASSRK
jgi:hypothetical protein